MLALIKSADSVELKVTVPLTDRSTAGAALGVDPIDGQIRQVYFFDTPDLALNKSGVVVRARRVQGRGNDSVVKLRPVVPDELPGDVRLVTELRCRGRRDAGRLRLLRLDEARDGNDRGQGRGCGDAAGEQAVLEGTALVP